MASAENSVELIGGTLLWIRGRVGMVGNQPRYLVAGVFGMLHQHSGLGPDSRLVYPDPFLLDNSGC